MGTGYPLLLMHGGLGVDHSTLSALVNCRDAFRLIFYDHRCNGRSRGAGIESLTWENLVTDAEALRERLGISKWAVLGHSFGGMIAQEYALRFPKSISHLILMDTGADASLVQMNAAKVLKERGFSRAQVDSARRLFNGEIVPAELPLIMLKLGKAYYHDPNLIMQIRALWNALRIRSRPDACIYGFQQLLKGWSIMNRLAEIHIPVLLIAGRSDFQFPPAHQITMASAYPNARYESIEDASHNPLIEKPGQTMELIRQFVK
jgi:proline iminopeptidase